MPKLSFIKTAVGLIPDGADAREWFDKLKAGAYVSGNMVVPRNVRFHRKFFAMLNVAYENHDWPETMTQYGPAHTTSGVFRRYVIVKAGYYDIILLPNGEPRAEAKSIKFGKMGEDEFAKLYSGVLDVILMEFLTNWKSGDMDRAVENMLSFV